MNDKIIYLLLGIIFSLILFVSISAANENFNVNDSNRYQVSTIERQVMILDKKTGVAKLFYNNAVLVYDYNNNSIQNQKIDIVK